MSDAEKAKRIHKMLYSCTDREEMCRYVVEVEDLCEKAIGVVIGWGWMLNEAAGHEKNDFDYYPMQTAKELVDRMHELGFGKVENDEHER